ncbi:MAG: hypothetical protein ACM3YE_17190 [Bacteroidota bacterium]
MSVFIIFWGIGAVIAIVYLTIRYLIPLLLFICVSIFEILQCSVNAFADGWTKERARLKAKAAAKAAGDGNK